MCAEDSLGNVLLRTLHAENVGGSYHLLFLQIHSSLGQHLLLKHKNLILILKCRL